MKISKQWLVIFLVAFLLLMLITILVAPEGRLTVGYITGSMIVAIPYIALLLIADYAIIKAIRSIRLFDERVVLRITSQIIAFILIAVGLVIIANASGWYNDNHDQYFSSLVFIQSSVGSIILNTFIGVIVEYMMQVSKRQELESSLQRVQNRLCGKTIESITQPQNYKTRVIVKGSQDITFLDINEIAYFYSDEKVVFAVMQNGGKKIVEKTLEELQGQLNPQQFCRISRGFLVSINSIQALEKHFNARLKATLHPECPKDAIISRERASVVLRWLGDE